MIYHQVVTFSAPKHIPDESLDQWFNSEIGRFLQNSSSTHARPQAGRGLDHLIYVSRRTLIGVFRANTPYYATPQEVELFKSPQPLTPNKKTTPPPTSGSRKK